ncbi:hypothetical protein L1987_25316 [Smallanthus sonchifolius]|uniref:Uncharacterized protein n=1 Tax=Smallanthus sonchifolius TaxID=185202 RepID=A0ACB9IN32_9ASTR|nr:hypothetical protein L1987_25316 [Smallanthus sonchifolius]
MYSWNRFYVLKLLNYQLVCYQLSEKYINFHMVQLLIALHDSMNDLSKRSPPWAANNDQIDDIGRSELEHSDIICP